MRHRWSVLYRRSFLGMHPGGRVASGSNGYVVPPVVLARPQPVPAFVPSRNAFHDGAL